MRATRGHTGNRRSHHALEELRFSTCKDCGALHLRHAVCMKCGKYRGKMIIDVAKQVEKKQRKEKAREKEAVK